MTGPPIRLSAAGQLDSNPGEAPYNTRGIRDLLNAIFSDEELVTFCFDYFRPVYDNFASGMTRLWKIHLLIDHCDRYRLFDRLLAFVRDLNPEQYDRFNPYLRVHPETPLVDTSPERSTVVIVLKGDLSTFSPERRALAARAAAGATAGILDIPPEQIRVLHERDGSLILELELPAEAAHRLLAMYRANDPAIRALGIEEVQVLPGPGPSGGMTTALLTGAIVLLVIGNLALGAWLLWPRIQSIIAPVPPTISPPALSLSPSRLDFGPQELGTHSLEQDVTVTNRGALPLGLGRATRSGQHAEDFLITGDTCLGSLPGGGRCTLKISFAPQAEGPRSATLTVTEATAGSSQTVTLGGLGTGPTLVTAVPNQTPVANDDAAATGQGQPVAIDVLGNDTDLDDDPLTLVSVTPGASGKVMINADDSVTYTPDPTFSGQDRFTYTIEDGRGASGTATVVVTVNPALADLVVTQVDAPDPATVGGELSYTVTVANRGPAPATGVSLVVELAAGLELGRATSSQGSCRPSPEGLSCDLGQLSTGFEATAVIVVAPGVVGNLINTTKISGNEPDPNPSNNVATEQTVVRQPTPPDLVVITLETAGPGAINYQGNVEVLVRVVVKNQGGTPAGIFKVSTEYSDLYGPFVVPFTVPGQDSIWYPFSSAALAAGGELTFAGIVTFQSGLQGQTVSLSATADSCSGDEFMPDFCRVEESDEGNNVSPPLSLSLPSNHPPSVQITIPAVDSSTDDLDYRYVGQDSYGWYIDVELQGAAMDPEDGALSGSSLVWTTDRTDSHQNPPSPRLGTGPSVNTRLYSSKACTQAGQIGDWHVITLSATDSDGNVSTAQRRIYMWSDCVI